jgi:hypothetical protein
MASWSGARSLIQYHADIEEREGVD